jgi:hypothetical protein
VLAGEEVVSNDVKVDLSHGNGKEGTMASSRYNESKGTMNV